MSLTADWRAGWAGRAERIAAARYGLAATAGLLGFAAVIEAVLRAAMTYATATGTSSDQGTQILGKALLCCALGLATTLPLAFLRPVPAAIVLSVASLLSLGLFRFLAVGGAIATLVAVYRSGRSGTAQGATSRAGGNAGGIRLDPAEYAAGALSVPFLVLAVFTGATEGTETRVLTVVLAALVPAAAWAGVARRARAEALLHTTAAHAIADTLVEHTARGERARIARELHDVVAHHISMIAVQAEAARLTTPAMPAAGAQRLSEIGDTARAGLTEMRRLLGVLREDAQAEIADRHPQPSLGQVPGLVDEARDSSGARCRLIISGAPVAVDPGVGLAAYRIVQEALTNARRHAPGAAVDVELRYGDGELRLVIRDNGPGPRLTVPSGGHGLHGMRERAIAVGGELRAGAAGVGGFLVEARLPGAGGAVAGDLASAGDLAGADEADG
ncbi:MAG TPA: sensor histidine kinase [Trebonia sp.]|jgi:signal transduction histidine kinase|nr:sensor histidine kinase [Trebonia sp.]